MALRSNALTVGQMVSFDQYVSSTPGSLPHTKGKETTAMQYTGVTLYVDHCSKFVFIYNQVSLGAGVTLVAKQAFESILKSFGFSVSNYHGDKGVFNSQAFKNDCKSKQQQLTFSGSGANHQNGVAECSIQMIVGWVRTLLLHAAIHWPTVDDLKPWPIAIQHAIYLWNILPDQHTKLSPLELISGSHVPNYTHLWCLHVWGFPTFVLDPRLQDGKKLLKWSPRSCLVCFVGYSSSHSSTVSLICTKEVE